jgi:hypothetical protein
MLIGRLSALPFLSDLANKFFELRGILPTAFPGKILESGPCGCKKLLVSRFGDFFEVVDEETRFWFSSLFFCICSIFFSANNLKI